MSALNLLSVIAPAVPTLSQGSAGEAASGFQSLLEAQSLPAAQGATTAGSGEDALASGTRPGPAETPAPEEVKTTDATAIGFLVAPTPPLTPLVLPAADGSAAAAEAKAPATGSGGGETDPATLPPATLSPPAPSAEGGDTPDTPPTMPLAPVDKALGAKTNEPQIQPAVSDFGDVPARLSDLRSDRPETAGRTATQVEAEVVEAQTRAAATPAPTPPSAPATATAAPPAPLRPLAERTSRPVETPVARTGETSGMAEPAKAAKPGVTPAVVPADQPAKPAELLVAAVTRDTANGGTSEDAMSEPVPGGETATAQTQAPAVARETTVSQLSRATVEATAQIAAQILRRLEGRSTRFEMALTPDELGRVDVKLDIDSEGRLNARLAFDNPAAATDLRGRADELRRQLEDAGFHLAEDAFEFADRDSGSSAFDRGQDARDGSARAFAAASRINTEIDLAQPPRWLSLSLTPSGLDMKV
jgi:flagellar hook-length control protein FliK